MRRGRDDLAFEFYDDWEEDEAEWGNDELDRLLAGNGAQPSRQVGMNYGSRITKRKYAGMPKDVSVDPTVVPKSSTFGFLERLPWKFGSKGFKYRPSASDLQENVGRGRGEGEENDDGEGNGARGRDGRNRSDTVASRSTTNSLSSRGDLFPSEDEDDAVPIGDEFAMVLERRNTGTASDDHSSRKARGLRSTRSPASTKTASSRDTKSIVANRRAASASSGNVTGLAEAEDIGSTSMTDLKQQEENHTREEEGQIEKKRQAAPILAQQRGLSNLEDGPVVSIHSYLQYLPIIWNIDRCLSQLPDEGHEPKSIAEVISSKLPPIHDEL